MSKLRLTLVLTGLGFGAIALGLAARTGSTVEISPPSESSHINDDAPKKPRINATEMTALGLTAVSLVGTGVYLVRRGAKPRA